MKEMLSCVVKLYDSKGKAELESLLESLGYEITWIDQNHVYAKRV